MAFLVHKNLPRLWYLQIGSMSVNSALKKKNKCSLCCHASPKCFIGNFLTSASFVVLLKRLLEQSEHKKCFFPFLKTKNFTRTTIFPFVWISSQVKTWQYALTCLKNSSSDDFQSITRQSLPKIKTVPCSLKISW